MEGPEKDRRRGAGKGGGNGGKARVGEKEEKDTSSKAGSGDDDNEEESDYRERAMSYGEKVAICRKIPKLGADALKDLLRLVETLEPHNVS